MNTNIHRLIGPSMFQSHKAGEARFVFLQTPDANKAQKEEIAQKLGAEAADENAKKLQGNPLHESLKRIQDDTKLAVMAVEAAPPTIKDRLIRGSLNKAGSVVGLNFLDASAKNVEDKINQMTQARLNFAENQLQNTEASAISAINNKLVQSTINVGFVKTKTQATKDFIAQLQKRIAEVKGQMNNGNTAALRQQLRNLGDSMKSATAVLSTMEKRQGAIERTAVQAKAESSIQFLQEAFKDKAEAAKLNGYISDYLDGNTAPLELAIQATAQETFPNVDDDAKRTAFERDMMRAAEAFNGGNTMGTIYRRLKDTVPGVGIAFMNPLVGLPILGASQVASFAYNRIRFGTNTVAEFNKNEIKGYLLERSSQNLDTMGQMVATENTTDRLKLLKKLKPGATIEVLVKDKPVALTIEASADENMVYAKDTKGTRYSFCLKPNDGGGHYFSTLDPKSKTAKHSLINAAKNAMFTVAA